MLNGGVAEVYDEIKVNMVKVQDGVVGEGNCASI